LSYLFTLFTLFTAKNTLWDFDLKNALKKLVVDISASSDDDRPYIDAQAPSDIEWSVALCFQDWLVARGGDGSIEIKQATLADRTSTRD
jgi:hypothetical protein